MSKILHKDELNLSEILKILVREKNKLLIIILVSLAVAFFFESSKSSQKISIKVQTELVPISTYEAAKYRTHNSVINSIINTNNRHASLFESKNYENKMEDREIIFKSKFKNLEIQNIDKEFLLNLFTDKIKDKSNLSNILKKFNYFDKKNFSNLKDYDNAVYSFSSSINLEKTGNFSYYITAQIFDKKKYDDFLEFLNFEINLQIQKELYDIFLVQLSNFENLLSYELEDIEAALLITQNETLKKILNKKRDFLLLNKDHERIKKAYANLPISKPNDFYAAKINFNQSTYNYQKVISPFKTYLIFGIFGIILGIFYALILNVAQKKK